MGENTLNKFVKWLEEILSKRGMKRGKYKKKKGLTGNSYYAAKAKKNFYYQDMGRKGGRPRMYNKIEVPTS